MEYKSRFDELDKAIEKATVEWNYMLESIGELKRDVELIKEKLTNGNR